MTWDKVKEKIERSGARNVRVDGERLMGNDGTVLTFDPKLAYGYAETDWDAVACRPTRWP